MLALVVLLLDNLVTVQVHNELKQQVVSVTALDDYFDAGTPSRSVIS